MKSVEDHVIELRQAQKNTPAERWRKPVIPFAVEDDASAISIEDGQPRPGVNATFDEETVERIRAGRVCLNCWEPLETAFPEQCPLCQYGIRKHQTIDFQEQYEGEKWVGPTTSISDELERLRWDGMERRWKPGSSIILPRGVDG